MTTNNEILIIGPPKSGKTTFLAQLYGRLVAKTGQLVLARAPKNIDGIKAAYDRLAEGLETETTPSLDNLEVEIPVKFGEHEFILHNKDYGGEQVRDITRMMEYDQNWITRSKENDRWILFVRPSEIYHHYDLSMKGFADVQNNDNEKPENRTSDQYHFIELIQALLHARGTGMKELIENPCLLIALTCWDELKTVKSPLEILQEKMPLFYNFIDSNWVNGKFRAIGVSAQGFSLNDETRDRYLDDLPESFGYLVLENNSEDPDLTKLVLEAMNL